MAEDRSWMYRRVLDGNEANVDFMYGVKRFIEFSFSNKSASERIPCPCINCKNRSHYCRNIVSQHLFNKGFMPNYERWYKHGEAVPNDAASVDYHNSNDILMEEMIVNAAGPEFDWERRDDPQQPNAAARDFFNMLDALESPLWEVEFQGESTIKCDQHSVLSAVTQLLVAKADFGLSVAGFDRILSIVKGMLPPKNGLPENFYRTKRMVKGLGMDYKKYDACPKNCMLYYKPEDKVKDKCDICGEARYTQPTRENSKPVARKVLRYLPITPRLQRLYMTRATAEKMRGTKKVFGRNLDLCTTLQMRRLGKSLMRPTLCLL